MDSTIADFLDQRRQQEMGRQKVLDSAKNAGDPEQAAADHEDARVRKEAVAAIQVWTEDGPMSKGEGATDRLIHLFIGIADRNADGELSDEEQITVENAVDFGIAYLQKKGASAEDLSLMFDSDDPDASNEAGDRVRDLIAGALPDGDDALSELNSFAFGEGATMAVMDAVYKKKAVIRAGKKVMVNKRISGHVHLTGEQKLAVHKMQLHSQSAGAKAKRKHSMAIHRKVIGGA